MVRRSILAELVLRSSPDRDQPLKGISMVFQLLVQVYKYLLFLYALLDLFKPPNQIPI